MFVIERILQYVPKKREYEHFEEQELVKRRRVLTEQEEVCTIIILLARSEQAKRYTWTRDWLSLASTNKALNTLINNNEWWVKNLGFGNLFNPKLTLESEDLLYIKAWVHVARLTTFRATDIPQWWTARNIHLKKTNELFRAWKSCQFDLLYMPIMDEIISIKMYNAHVSHIAEMQAGNYTKKNKY